MIIQLDQHKQKLLLYFPYTCRCTAQIFQLGMVFFSVPATWGDKIDCSIQLRKAQHLHCRFWWEVECWSLCLCIAVMFVFMLSVLTLQLRTVLFMSTIYSFYKCVFDAVNGGGMTPKEFVRFLKLKNEHCWLLLHPYVLQSYFKTLVSLLCKYWALQEKPVSLIRSEMKYKYEIRL
jgi:hypothetical protein